MISKSLRSDIAQSPETAAGEQRVLRFPEVRQRTGLSKTTIWRGVRDGWFPKLLELSPGCVGWLEHEINDWIANRVAARDEVHINRPGTPPVKATARIGSERGPMTLKRLRQQRFPGAGSIAAKKSIKNGKPASQ